MYKNLILIHDNVKDKQIFYNNCLSDTCPIYIDSNSIKTESDLIKLIEETAGNISKVENIGIVFWNTGNRIEILEYSEEELTTLDKYNDDNIHYNDILLKNLENSQDIQPPQLPSPPVFPYQHKIFSNNLLNVIKKLKLNISPLLQYIDLITCNMFYSEEFKSLAEIGVDIRYSTDITGISGNWILESHAVNITPLYFKDEIEQYPHNLDLEPPPLQISTADELYRLMVSTSSSVLQLPISQSYTLTADIDMTSYTAQSIGTTNVAFSSNFNGNNKTITIYDVLRPSTFERRSYVGFFGYALSLSSSTPYKVINNMNITYQSNVIICDDNNNYNNRCGGFAGNTGGTIDISNCTVKYNSNVIILSSYNNDIMSYITANTTIPSDVLFNRFGITGGNAGGFIGMLGNTNTTNCSVIYNNTGVINIVGYNSGGFSGYTASNITNCNINTLSATSSTSISGIISGGFTSFNNGSIISNCSTVYKNNNKIKSVLYTGGFCPVIYNCINCNVTYGNNCSIVGGQAVGGFIGQVTGDVSGCSITTGNNFTLKIGATLYNGTVYGPAGQLAGIGGFLGYYTSINNLTNNKATFGDYLTIEGTSYYQNPTYYNVAAGGYIGFYANDTYVANPSILNQVLTIGNNATISSNTNINGSLTGICGGIIGAARYIITNIIAYFGNNITISGGNSNNGGTITTTPQNIFWYGVGGLVGVNLGPVSSGGVRSYTGNILNLEGYFGSNITITGGNNTWVSGVTPNTNNGDNLAYVGGIAGNAEQIRNCIVQFKDNVLITGGNFIGANSSYCGGITGIAVGITSSIAIYGNNITITGGSGIGVNNGICGGIAGRISNCYNTYCIFKNNTIITGGENTAQDTINNIVNQGTIGGLFGNTIITDGSLNQKIERTMCLFGNNCKLSGGKGNKENKGTIGGLYGISNIDINSNNFAIYGDNTIFTGGEGTGINTGSVSAICNIYTRYLSNLAVIFGDNYIFRNYLKVAIISTNIIQPQTSYSLTYGSGSFISSSTATPVQNPIADTKSVQSSIFSIFDSIQDSTSIYVCKWLKYLIFIRQYLMDDVMLVNTPQYNSLPSYSSRYYSEVGNYNFVHLETKPLDIDSNNTSFLSLIFNPNFISNKYDDNLTIMFKVHAVAQALEYSYKWYIDTTYGILSNCIKIQSNTIAEYTPVKFLAYDQTLSTAANNYTSTSFTIYNFIKSYNANGDVLLNGDQYYFIPSQQYTLNVGFNTFNIRATKTNIIYTNTNVTPNTVEIKNLNDSIDATGSFNNQTTETHMIVAGLYYTVFGSSSSYYKTIPKLTNLRLTTIVNDIANSGTDYLPLSCIITPIDPYNLDDQPIEYYTVSGNSSESTLTDSDKLSILFKKYQGYANTDTRITDASVEYPINASPFNLSNRIAVDIVPTSNIPSTYTIDTAGTYNKDTFTLQTFGASGGNRYMWNKYCYISYYSKILLKPVPTNPGRSFFFYSMGYNMLTNIIPPNTVSSGYTYFITVEKKIINNGSSYWVTLPEANYILDKDAGILTIYEENSEINGTNPPRISYWRYEGRLLGDYSATIKPNILPNAMMYKDSVTNEINSTSLITVDPYQQTVNIGGHIQMTGILDPLAVILIPSANHPLTVTDSRYPYAFWYSSTNNKVYFGTKAISLYDPILDPNFSGPTGPQGLQGAMGQMGLPGIAGVAGPQGPQGFQGFAGERGIDGIIGRDGVTGPTGERGIDGATGAQGFTGMMGPQGPSGSGSGSGDTGPTGSEGPTGSQGPQGPPGSGSGSGSGDTGPQGPTGIQGPTGPQGERGIDGIIGVDGAQGPQGFTGSLGPQGPQGFTGSTVGVTELYMQPPAPTTPTNSATSIQININWVNPEQKQLSFLPVKVPLIKDLHITLEDSATPTPNTISIYNSTIADPYISTLIISNQTGSSQQSGTTYTWYKNAVQIEKPFKVTIWYTNYSTDTPNKLVVENLEFATGGAPSIPISITINTNTITTTQATLVVTPGQYTDALLQNNLPTISTYNFIYKALSSTRRGDLYIAASDLTTSSAGATKILTGLYAGTTYETSVSATNSLGSTSEYLTPRVQFTTKLPTMGQTIQDIPLSSYYSTVYSSNAYNNGTLATNPIMYNGSTWPSTGNIGTIYITDGPAVTGSKVELVVNNGVSDSNSSEIDYTLSAGGTNTVTNGADGKAVIAVNSTVSDPYTGGNSGFYWQSDLKAQVGQGVLTAGVGQHSLKFTQKFSYASGSPTTYSRNIQFLVDSLPLNTAPSITDFQITDNSIKEQVSGVSICPGTWSLSVSNVLTQNVVRYFHAQKLLTYSFANSSNQDLLTSFQGVGNQANTFLTTPVTLTPVTQDSIYRYNPQITITAYNINITNNSGQLQKQVDIVIDKPSKLIKTGYSATNQTPNGVNPGERVKTSTAAFATPQLQSGRTDYIATYSQFRAAYDDTKAINTAVGTEGCNDLQLLGGLFITKSYTDIQGGYQNYGAGLDYTQIAATGYRWSAFRWKVASGQLSALSFTIKGITGSDSGLTRDIATPKVLTASGKEIKVYYRIENQADSGGTGNPSDVEFTQNSGAGISTVWVDANSIYEQSNFGKYMGVRQYTGVLGGAETRSSITLQSTSVTYNVTTPIFQLGSSANIYIYVTIGLPMDSDIAFSSIGCTGA